MIDQTIDDAASPLLPIQKTSELTVGIVEEVCANVQDHSDDVEAEIAIEIQMAGGDSDDPAEKCDHRRRHPQLREKLRQAERDLAIKIKVDNPLDVAGLVARFQRRKRGIDLLRH